MNIVVRIVPTVQPKIELSLCANDRMTIYVNHEMYCDQQQMEDIKNRALKIANCDILLL